MVFIWVVLVHDTRIHDPRMHSSYINYASMLTLYRDNS